MKSRACVVASAIAFTAFFVGLHSASAQELGGPGESCRARSDCSSGLKCIDETCRRASADDDDDDGDGGDMLDSEFGDMRVHLGLMFGGGPTHTDRANGDAIGSLLFALKGGILIDRVELGIEFAPATFVIAFNPDLPSVELNGYGGYHIPVYKSISWPLRLGIGFTTVTFDNNVLDTLFEVRADLIGASVLLDPFLIDIYLPSWRINTDFEDGATFTYIFGIGGAWAPEI